MENLIVMSKRKNPARQTTRQHAFLMGLVLTDRGARLPLPRKSYYTKEYCRKHKRRFRTTMQLAAAMIRELRVPDDVDVVVTFDSAFDAGAIHKRVPKTPFSCGFSARSESGAGPHAGAGRGDGSRATRWWPGRGVGRGRSLPCWNSRWTTKTTSSPVGGTPTTCESRKRSGGMPPQRAKRRSPNWETA